MFAYVCICLHMFVYVCICLHMFVYVCICLYMFVYVCICLHMFVYVCICLYMFIVYNYIYEALQSHCVATSSNISFLLLLANLIYDDFHFAL